MLLSYHTSIIYQNTSVMFRHLPVYSSNMPYKQLFFYKLKNKKIQIHFFFIFLRHFNFRILEFSQYSSSLMPLPHCPSTGRPQLFVIKLLPSFVCPRDFQLWSLVTLTQGKINASRHNTSNILYVQMYSMKDAFHHSHPIHHVRQCLAVQSILALVNFCIKQLML